MFGLYRKYKRILGDALKRNDIILADIESRLNQLETLQRRTLASMLLANEVSDINTRAFLEYRNAHRGKTVAILATGPSLKLYTPFNEVIHIGVNGAHRFDAVELDFYFSQDHRYHDKGYLQELESLHCPIFLGLCATTPLCNMEPSESFSLHLDARRYFFDPSPSCDLFPNISHHPLMDFFTVVFPALHFALYTNPAKIFLVGCDVTSDGHFDGSICPDTSEELEHYLIHRLIGYRRVRDFAAQWYPETEIVSVNPVNLRGLFSDYFTNTENGLPSQSESSMLLAESNFTDEAISVFVKDYLTECSQVH
jgi:hypothetical protein